MVLSRKAVAVIVTNVLTLAAAYAVTKMGVQLSEGDSALIAGAVAAVSSSIAAWLVKEIPAL